jgi:Putative peptidoglycan binding domain
MIKKHNYRMSRKIHHRLSYNNITTIAALFSVILILTSGGIGLPLLQQQAYASSQQVQGPSTPSPTQGQRSFGQAQPSSTSLRISTPVCGEGSTLQLGSTGTKVAGLQHILTQLGYGPLLGQSGIDGKFGTSTQNAVKNFQQHNGLQPVDGVVGPRTWEVLCDLMTSPAARIQQQQPAPIQQQQPQGAAGCATARPIAVNLYNAFIRNPDTSTLDLLPRGLGEKYKNFNWDIYDYPGVNRGEPGPGPNEKMAHEMFQALAKIACEHRPIDPRGLTSTAVAKKDALNPYLNPWGNMY